MKGIISHHQYEVQSRKLLYRVLENFGHEYKMADNRPNKFVEDGNGVLLNEIFFLLKKEVGLNVSSYL